MTDKCKARFDVTAEELERLLLQKEGESYRDTPVQGRSPGGVGGKRAIGKAVAKGGLLLKGKNPGNVRRDSLRTCHASQYIFFFDGQLQRQEEDVRARMSSASDAYRKAVTETQAIRQEYFNFQLPRLLRVMCFNSRVCSDIDPMHYVRLLRSV